MASEEQSISSVLHPVSDPEGARRQLESTLLNTAFFSDFTSTEVRVASGFMPVFTVEPGDGVYVEGTRRAGYMCIVMEGALDIVKDNEKGSSRRIGTAKIGDTVGEMSLIDGLPHSATAVARDTVKLAVLTEKKLNYLCKEHPAICSKLLRKVAEVLSLRLREVNLELGHFRQ